MALSCPILGFVDLVLAQEDFKSEHLELKIPDNFQRIEHEAAILVLRDKTQGFPTFNAVLLPADWPFRALSEAEQGKKIEDSYHLIGLKNAKVISSSFVELNARPALKAQLNYQITGVDYLAEVWLLSLEDRHLILTAVFKCPPKEADLSQIQHLVQKIIIKGAKTSEQSKISRTPPSVKITLVSILVVALAFLLLWLLLRRIRRGKT